MWLFEALPAYFGVKRRERQAEKEERNAYYRSVTPLWMRVGVAVAGPWAGLCVLATWLFSVPIFPAFVVGIVPIGLLLLVALITD